MTYKEARFSIHPGDEVRFRDVYQFVPNKLRVVNVRIDEKLKDVWFECDDDHTYHHRALEIVRSEHSL